MQLTFDRGHQVAVAAGELDLDLAPGGRWLTCDVGGDGVVGDLGERFAFVVEEPVQGAAGAQASDPFQRCPPRAWP